MAKGETNRWRSIQALPVSKGNAAKQNDILRMDYSWNFMAKFVRMGTQVMDRKGDMRLAPFHGTMMGPGGGVSEYHFQTFSN